MARTSPPAGPSSRQSCPFTTKPPVINKMKAINPLRSHTRMVFLPPKDIAAQLAAYGVRIENGSREICWSGVQLSGSGGSVAARWDAVPKDNPRSQPCERDLGRRLIQVGALQ